MSVRSAAGSGERGSRLNGRLHARAMLKNGELPSHLSMESEGPSLRTSVTNCAAFNTRSSARYGRKWPFDRSCPQRSFLVVGLSRGPVRFGATRQCHHISNCCSAAWKCATEYRYGVHCSVTEFIVLHQRRGSIAPISTSACRNGTEPEFLPPTLRFLRLAGGPGRASSACRATARHFQRQQ